jgi:hypothetical protein
MLLNDEARLARALAHHSSLFASLLFAFFDGAEVSIGRPLKDFSVGIKARAVAGAIPRLLFGVPIHDAA